jgi:ABC-type oligopeptide transport system substrate-binding subunit
LERFADFYNGPSKLNTVNIFLGADASNPQTQYEQGKLDYVYTSGKTVEQAQDPSNPLSKELVVKPQLEVTYVGFNNRHEPFDDPKVRQAFYMVIDRDKIVRAMFENKVVKANTLMPPGLPGYTGNPGPLQFDINRARDLLAQSTYHSPQNLPKITLYSTGSSMDKLLQDVYRQAFGIEIEVRQPDYKDFRTGLSSGQFQMYLTAWGADYPDPDNFLRALLGKGSTFNECGYNNPQFEELLKQADQQTDPQKRLEMYGKAEQIALTDAPLLPIYHSVGYLLVKPYVKGLELSSSGIISLKDVYIVK